MQAASAKPARKTGALKKSQSLSKSRASKKGPASKKGLAKRNGPAKRIVHRPLGQFVHLLKRFSPLWPFGRKRILLLEDDTSMQKLVSKLLTSLHVKVELFGNGRAVNARIATEDKRYDVLLLDLMMPHDGGLTVLRNLRDHHPSLLGRVILLTGSGKGITDPWSDLVFAVVHKPFDGSALVTTVRECAQQPASQ